MGLASAWRLAQHGWSVRIFDLRKAAREASRAAAGMLAPGGEIDSNSVLAQTALRSLATYPDFVRDLRVESGLPVEFSQCGAVEVAFDDAQHKALAEKAARQAAIGIVSNPCRYQNWNARHYPADAIVDPLSITHALVAACRKRGVEIHEHEPVTGILPNGSGVRTAVGDYPSDRVLIAAGAWSSALLPGLPEVYPVRGHLVYFEMEPGLLKTIVRSGDTYVLQRESGGVVAGSSMEDAGFDRTLNAAIVDDIHKRAAKLIPELADVTPVDCWNGLRPATNVGPVVGRVTDTNVWTAYGHFRNGILLAPDTAQTIASEFDTA